MFCFYMNTKYFVKSNIYFTNYFSNITGIVTEVPKCPMVILSKIIHLILANCQENIQMEHQQRSYLEHKNNIQLNRYINYLLLVDNFYICSDSDGLGTYPKSVLEGKLEMLFLHILYQKRLRKSNVQLWANSRYPFHVYLYPIRDIDFIGSFLKFLEKPKLRTTSKYT